MARRTSFFVTAAVLATVAGCATISPTGRPVTNAQEQPGQQVDQAKQQIEQPKQQIEQAKPMEAPTLTQQQMAQQPISANLGALAAGMPLSTSPLTAGAMALPSLGALAGAIPAAIPGPGASILATFPTLAFGARWVDIYTPLWATSARVAALAGLPPGLGSSILTRLHFFGINSHFGLFAPYLLWNGIYRPFFVTHPHLGVNYYPFVAATGAALTPFTYSSPLLPGAYAAAGTLPAGALSAACGPIAASACPGLGTGALVQ
ncbi:MAG: hypothetical protein FJZ01_14490 [Candidatus Sericytochromatia bacterium]|nr:hypothetical protein [Candidatus Tanganyikabacteria bacterium]